MALKKDLREVFRSNLRYYGLKNKFTQEEALSRIKSQLPQEKKAKKADFVIDNNSSIDVLQKYIERFIIQLEDNGET